MPTKSPSITHKEYAAVPYWLSAPPRPSTDSNRDSCSDDYDDDRPSTISSLDDGDTESGSWSDDTLSGPAEWVIGGKARRRKTRWLSRLSQHPRGLFVAFVSLATTLGLIVAYPFPTTIHVFLGGLVGLTTWTVMSWIRLFMSLWDTAASPRTGYASLTPSSSTPIFQLRATTWRFATILFCTGIVLSSLFLGVTVPEEQVPDIPRGAGHKYFIGANFYNNAKILPHWSSELLKLVEHLGPENTFVSIYESNSNDETPALIAKLGEDLEAMGSRARVVSESNPAPRWWPYNTSPERIEYLSEARNRVMEPLQSNDSSVRLEDYAEFEKVVFLNDVYYSWQSVVRLLATALDGEEANYDLACAMDYQLAGLYDGWVARDICGTPVRITWPFVKDPVSIKLLRNMRPFPVSACWNGMVAFPTKPYLYTPPEDEATKANMQPQPPKLQKRGWKMIDNATYPNSRMSPALTTPIKFRASNVEACDHSECFLFSYDLHRMYNTRDRPARIIMNPNVQVAYKKVWYGWYAKVSHIPVVEWWAYYWSHGIPMQMVDFIWEFFMRRRDYCTWSALAATMPERCPALPAEVHRSWEE